MDEITRPELDAKLELLETRMDARAQRIEGMVSAMVEKIDLLADETRETRRESRNHRSQIILAVIAALLGFWWALSSFVPAEIQKTISAFEVGRTAGKAEAQSSAKGELAPPSK